MVMSLQEEYRMHRPIIYSIVLIFEIFGLFGNINLIAVILRNKILRSNFGCIMLALAFFHTVCLFFELINMGYGILATFFSYRIFRSLCFHTTFPVIMAHCLQTGTICILSLDLFLAVAVPFKYRHFHLSWYLPVLFFLPVCYAVGIAGAAKMFLDNSEILMCNPPSSMIPSVREWWYEIMLTFSFLTVVFYSGALGLLSVKMRRNSSDIRLIEKKALRTLKVLIIIFLFTRFFSTGLATLVGILKLNPDTISLIQNYNVIPAMAAYSQNAYVCFFRSEEYRRLLTEQISFYIPFMKTAFPIKSVERSTTIKRGATVVKF